MVHAVLKDYRNVSTVYSNLTEEVALYRGSWRKEIHATTPHMCDAILLYMIWVKAH